jgi:hypothetical protein
MKLFVIFLGAVFSLLLFGCATVDYTQPAPEIAGCTVYNQCGVQHTVTTTTSRYGKYTTTSTSTQTSMMTLTGTILKRLEKARATLEAGQSIGK